MEDDHFFADNIAIENVDSGVGKSGGDVLKRSRTPSDNLAVGKLDLLGFGRNPQWEPVVEQLDEVSVASQ